MEDRQHEHAKALFGSSVALFLLTAGLFCVGACGGPTEPTQSERTPVETAAAETTAAETPPAEVTPERTQWRCSNPVEVQCWEGDCEVKEGEDFTPLDVSFDSAGEVAVCAYSGCWEGQGRVEASDEFLIVTGRRLPFSTAAEDEESREDVAIVLGLSDRLGTLKVGSFAVPIVCAHNPR